MKSILLAAVAALPILMGVANAAPNRQSIEGYGHAAATDTPRPTPNNSRISANMVAPGIMMSGEPAKARAPAFNPFLNAGLNGGGG